MADLNFQARYALQDTVLSLIFAEESVFYLTGGTCLHRFYFGKRYSDDLDFFTGANNLFRDEVRVLLDRFRSESLEFHILADTRDFVRLTVHNSLRIDLVNDRVFRYGKNVLHAQKFHLDNLENIAANKICALFGRDDPKDVFDIVTICSSQRVDWEIVLAAASKKCVFDGELLEFRLRSFPLELLDLLNVPDSEVLPAIKAAYPSMLEHICTRV